MTFGGDGFFVAVDPDDSDIAYSETRSPADARHHRRRRTWAGMAPAITQRAVHQPVRDGPDRPQAPDHGGPPGRRDRVRARHRDRRLERRSSTSGRRSTPATPAADADTGGPGELDVRVDAARRRGLRRLLRDLRRPEQPGAVPNGLATNVGGAQPPARARRTAGTSPRRRACRTGTSPSIAIDPVDPRTVYVTLGGYCRRWTPPGTLDGASNAGGHLYVSRDAGQTFTDISGALPNAPATWVVLRGEQILVGTDVGVFVLSPPKRPGPYTVQVLGTGLPNAPISSLTLKPDDPNLLIAATFGRGIWQYRFGPPPPAGEPPPPPPPPPPCDRRDRGGAVRVRDERGRMGPGVHERDDVLAAGSAGPPLDLEHAGDPVHGRVLGDAHLAGDDAAGRLLGHRVVVAAPQHRGRVRLRLAAVVRRRRRVERGRRRRRSRA